MYGARSGRSCSAYRQVGGQREGQGRQAGTSRGGRSCRDASRYDRSRKESGTRCALCSAEESEVVQMILKGHPWSDRKSVVKGKSVSVSVDLGGRRIIKKKKHINNCKKE